MNIQNPKITSRTCWCGELTPEQKEGLNILIYNDHFPAFPGTGGYEFLNTTKLAEFAREIGLVSMIHNLSDLNKTKTLSEKQIKLYLWKTQDLKNTKNLSNNNEAKLFSSKLKKNIKFFLLWFRKFSDGPEDSYISKLNFRNMSEVLLTALRENKWQVFVVIQSSSALVIDYVPPQPLSVLVMHDIRSLVYQRRAAIADSLWERFWFRIQAKRYFKFEKHYTKKYDLTVALSQTDAAWIQKNYQPKHLTVVPVPIDTSYYKSSDSTLQKKNRIIFTGLMNHPPNVDAALFFAQKVFPLVKNIIADVEFFIVGRHPSPEIIALNQLPGITATGEVPDIRSYLTEANIVVVPLRFGSGVRQKILEAWSMEKCVISTTVGAEGLQYQNGVDILIVDSPIEMSNKIIELLQNENLCQSFGKAGKKVAIEKHNPQIIAKNYYNKMKELYNKKINEKPPIRVLLDLNWMHPGSAGGIEHLARSFLKHLINMDSYNYYTVLAPTDSEVQQEKNIKVVYSDSLVKRIKNLKYRIQRKIFSILKLDYWQTQSVPILYGLADLNCDVVISFTGFISSNFFSLKNLLIVPDIQHEYFPEFFSSADLQERQRFYTASIHHADHIAAISEFTRQTLIDKLGVLPEKITTVPLAADPIFTRNDDDAQNNGILNKYNIEYNSYIFFPAHTWPHKNHITLLQAISILGKKYQLFPKLICTGGERGAQEDIKFEIEKLNLLGQIRFLGHVPRQDLPALYRCANSLVYPSLFEGFGMPVLEAMSCGCPVICSNTTSLPEIAGDAALLIDPTDPEKIADAIFELFKNQDLRNDLIKKGFLQAKKFSWEKYTSQIISAVQQIYATQSGKTYE